MPGSFMPKLSNDGLSWITNQWDNAQTIKQVASSRALSAADFDCMLACASGITITIPTDAVLGISDPAYAPTIVLQQAGAVAIVFSAPGVTLQGTPPTLLQYGSVGLVRTGANTWAFL